MQRRPVSLAFPINNKYCLNVSCPKRCTGYIWDTAQVRAFDSEPVPPGPARSARGTERKLSPHTESFLGSVPAPMLFPVSKGVVLLYFMLGFFVFFLIPALMESKSLYPGCRPPQFSSSLSGALSKCKHELASDFLQPSAGK